MTFSIAATDGSGRFGIAVSSSSPAVAARCAHLRDGGVGAVSSQNITDPRLGTALLDRLQAGYSAQEAIDASCRNHPQWITGNWWCSTQTADPLYSAARIPLACLAKAGGP